MAQTTRSIIYAVTDFWPFPDKTETVKKTFVEIVPQIKKERSCLKYELCESLNETNQLTLLHAWSTEQALEEHLRSEIILKTNEEIGQFLSKPTEIRRYKNIGWIECFLSFSAN